MLRSLFTGISGLSAHQQMLDVTANNIANVNTAGFKSSSTEFQDTLSQTMQGAAGALDANGNLATPGGDPAAVGGTNALQIGLGVKLGATAIDMEQGSSEATGVGTDLQIQGDGFFTVMKKGQALYTRAGAFHIDNDGDLVSPDGAIVTGVAYHDDGNGKWVAEDQPDANATPPTEPTALDLSPLKNGYFADGSAQDGQPIYAGDTPPTDPTKIGHYISYAISSSGTINATKEDGTVQAIGQITMASFANPNGLEKAGDSEYTMTAASGDPTYGAANSGEFGSLNAGYLEMSNVDLGKELTNLIIAERGFQANSKSVSTSDEILQTLVNLKR